MEKEFSSDWAMLNAEKPISEARHGDLGNQLREKIKTQLINKFAGDPAFRETIRRRLAIRKRDVNVQSIPEDMLPELVEEQINIIITKSKEEFEQSKNTSESEPISIPGRAKVINPRPIKK